MDTTSGQQSGEGTQDEPLISPFSGFQSHPFGSPSVESVLSSFFVVFLSLLSVSLLGQRALEHMKHEGGRLGEVIHDHNEAAVEEERRKRKALQEGSGGGGGSIRGFKPKSINLTVRMKHRMYSTIGRYVPEAGLVMFVGIVAGWLMCSINNLSTLTTTTTVNTTTLTTDNTTVTSSTTTVQDYLLQFSPTTFFLLLLPPIIFNSGYHMNRSLFYPLLPAISAYAILGTAVSATVIGIVLYQATQAFDCQGFQPTLSETLAFGALISATDPVSTLAVFQSKRVDPTLFYLVFGESVLNDAVGLVMYETLRKFVGFQHSGSSAGVAVLDFCIIFVCSTLLGLLCGIVSSLVMRSVKSDDNILVECGLFSLVVYLPFCIAEVLSMSGIVTILFAGIMCKCYGAKNLSEEGRTVMDDFFRILAHLSETAIFLQLGLSVFGLTSSSPDSLNVPFVGITLVSCLLARAVNVYPITWILNNVVYSRNRETGEVLVKNNTQHMLYLSGLRGAVAFACAQTFPDDFGNRGTFVVTTMAVVLVTTGVMGGGTESLLELLGIEQGVDEDDFDGGGIPTTKIGWGGLKRIHGIIYSCTVGKRTDTDLGERDHDDEEGVEMEGRNLVLHDSLMTRGVVMGGDAETPMVENYGPTPTAMTTTGGAFFGAGNPGSVRSTGSIGSMNTVNTAATTGTKARRQRQHSRRDSSRNIFDFGAKKTPTRRSKEEEDGVYGN